MDEQAFFEYIDYVMTTIEGDFNTLECNDGCEDITLSCRKSETTYDIYSLFLMYHNYDEAFFVKVYIQNEEIAYSVWTHRYDDEIRTYSREATMEKLKEFFPLEEDLFESKEPSEE
jgi:hypothetical protein